MDNSKLTNEAKKAQFLAGIIKECEEVGPTPEKDGINIYSEFMAPNDIYGQITLDMVSRAKLMEQEVQEPSPEIKEIIERVEELLKGSFYKIHVQPYGIDLRYEYWRRLPLGIYGQLKYEFDVYEDTDQGDEEVRKIEYQIRPKTVA